MPTTRLPHGRRGFDRGDIRRLNAGNVLRELRLHGGLSKAKLATRTGLTRATISNITAVLKRSGIIRETSWSKGASGRPGRLLEIDPAFGSAIGIEIDIGAVTAVLSDLDARTLWRGQRELKHHASPEAALDLCHALIAEAMDHAKASDMPCLGIGLALAGLVDHGRGELAYGPYLGWHHVPLKRLLEEHFHLPVHLENQANCAAIGLAHFGSFKAIRNLIYINVGGGMAAGILIDGRLLRGTRGFAGQAGHARIHPGGEPCACGQRGCWGAEVNIDTTLRRIREKCASSHRRGPLAARIGSHWDRLELGAVAAAAAEGDADVLAVLERSAETFAIGIANLANLFNPECVVIGGALRPILPFLRERIETAARNGALPQPADNLRIAVSTTENDTLTGCIALVVDHLLANPPLAHKRAAPPRSKT